MAFNLTAQLNLQGPTNVKQIAAQIKKDLGNINANVTFKLDPAVTKNVAALSSSLKTLNATFGSTTTAATSAAAAIKAFGNSINSVKVNNIPQQINAAANAVNKLNKASSSSAKDLGSASAEMQEFGKQAGLAIRRFVAFSTVTSVIYGLTNSISQGVQAFIDYDKELVKLQQVTGESSSGLAKLQDQITNLSTTFGVSSKDLTSVASTLAQAGLSARETEKALRALALSSLAPSFDDMNETVEGSIALMRQFGISADDLEGALGAVNTVAARFAVESSDIITAVQRTGSVFATASKGVSEGKDALNEFIAVFTSVRATTRESAETISTGLRTIFTRIQRGGTIDALKEFGVNLTDTEGKFVGAYKAVELLSKGLSGIDPRSLQFSKIVEELGGFRQIGKVIPLIQQFTVAQEALKTAQAGQGSLAKDAATAQLSLANQISKVRQEFFALFREIGQSKGFQSLIRGALSLASGLIKVTDAIKGILPALAIITAFKGAKALTQFASGFSTGVKRGPDGKANGGVIRKFARGGVVPGTGSGDTVPAMLEPGEFVIRKKAVETIGADNLHSMNKYGSGGSIRAGKSNRRKRFGNGGKLYDDIDVQEYSKSNKQYAGRLKAYDADSINLLVDPTQTLVNKRFKKLTGDLIYPSEKGKFKVTSRLEGIDAFEIKASKKEREEYASQGGKGPAYASNREKGKRAKDITIDFISGLGKEKLAKIFIDANKVDYYGRPMAEIGALNKKLVGENVAKYSGTKKGQDIIQADKLANRLEIMKKNSGFGNTNKSSWDRVIKDDYMFNYMPEESQDRFDSLGNIRQNRARLLKTIKDSDFTKKMTETKGLAKFMVGGKVERKIGVVDTDVLRDEANAAIVRPAMEKLGITDVSDYTTKLGELAGNARKSGSLSRFRAIAGAAGSGKSSLATGKGANDDATLRKTIRSQILTPEDINKVNEVIVLTSTASQTKLDAYLKDVDRAYVLSSNSREEQDRVRSNRESRDITGEGLYGRKPGTTRAADIDFGLEETILRDELGKRATVLGRKKDSFGLRRKRESELPEIVQAGGFYMGGFAPPTRGHRGALDTLLENMLAKNPNSSLEDILVSVAPDLPMIVGKEGIDHAARYGIFPSDIRTLFSQMNFGNAMISTQSQTAGGLPKFMEVTDAGDRRKFARLKGAMAITSGKDDKTLGKYQRAGIDVTDIPRIEDISATAVRDALFNGDDKTLTSLMNPDIASILMGNRAQLRNRSTMVPMLIEEIQKFVDQDKVRSNAEVAEILSNAPGGPYGNVSADLKKNYPEIAEQVKQIRDKRDRVSKGAFGYRAFNIISALSAKYPETYGLDPSRKSPVSAQPSDITREAISAQISEQMAGEFGGVPTEMPSGLEEAILKNVEKATQVKKSSGILPAQGSEILKRFGTERLPNDPSFGPFSGKTVRDTADGGKLKYWNSAFRPETKADKLAYYIATRDYLIDKFNESQGTQKATALAETTNAVLSSKQLGLVGLNPLGYTGLLGPETWNLGVDPSGQERSIDASIVQRGLPTQYQNVIDYLSGQTEEIVGGAAKLLGISAKKLTKKQRETLGQGNIEGALLEQIFGSADATILDDALRTRPIDFPMGIGSKAAKIFGIDPDIPTEVKRTIDSNSRGKAVEEFQKYFRQQYSIPEPKELEQPQKLARGGKASRRFTFSKEPIGPSPFDIPKSKVDYFSLEQGSGFSALEFNSLARDAKTFGLNLEEFKEMLEKRRARKAALSGVKTDFSSLLAPETLSDPTPRQQILAEMLKGEPDPGLRPMKRYVDGGEVYSPQQLVSLAKYRTGPFPGGGTDSEFINRYLEDNDSFMEYLKTFHADPPKAYDATKNAAKDLLEMFNSKESMSGSKRSGKLYSTVAGGKLKTILTQIGNPLSSNKDIPDAIGKSFNLNGSLLSTSESPDTAAVFQPENGSSAMLSIFRNKNIPSIDVDKTIFDTSTEDDVIKALSKYIDPVSGKSGADYLSRSRSATRIEKEFILPPTSKFRIDDIDRIISKDQEDKLLGGDIRHIEGMKVQQFADGGKTKLYHGSNTGVDDSVLKSFKEKGALSNIATGYGQGAGFYLYTEKNKAEQQAKMRVGGGSGFTVTSGDTSGKPMVLSFDEILDPKTYDLDYELQKNLVTQWLYDNFDKIKDKAAPDKEKGLAGIRDVIAKDASKGVMSAGIKVQSAEGSRKALYAGGDSNIREGEILGQIMNRLQSGDPELINSFESELFKRPLGLALKYTGSNPLKPTNIETFANGGQAGISSQDTVPALLTPGEFVINKKAAQNIGYGKLEKLNKADKIQGYNKGGVVGGGVIQRFATGGSVFSIEAIMQGLKGLAEPAVQKLKTRPETIDSKSLEASSELFNNVKLLAQGFEEAGYSMISFKKILEQVGAGADISYKDIERAMTKDVERLKITGASIDTIIAAEKALKAVRDQAKTAVVKRQFLEAGLKESKTGKVLGSGGAQQAILTEAEKKEKLITAQRKSQIEKDLIKKDPSLLGDKDKLERRTNRRLEKEQRQIKEQAFASATEKVTGIKRSELSGMGIGGADIQSYVSQSMTDRKTLAQMDKQLIAMRLEEYKNAGTVRGVSVKSASEALALAKEEVSKRREMINEMAKEQGEKGVGAAGLTDIRNSPIIKAIQGRYFSGTASQGVGTALGDVGMAAGLVGGQGKNIANLMYDTSTDAGKVGAAKTGAAIEKTGSTLATGLTTASQLMAINPYLGAAVAIGTALYAGADAAFDFTGAQKTAALEMEKNLRFEEVAASEKDLAKAFKDFEKDLGNIDLQKALDKALVRSSESSLKAVAAETKVAENEKGLTRTWTQFLSGAEKPKMDVQDVNELASKQAERNADSGDKAFALISQKINTGASVESIQADKELIGARRALVLADEDALKTVRARIISEGGYDKVSQQRQDAILDEVANEKILTNVQVQSAIKTKQMSDALEAADKAGRKLAASFEKLSSIVSESVNRIKFESDVRKSSAEKSRSALRGQSEDSGPKLRELNVLENPNAYSEQDFNDALKSATAGVDEKTRNQLIGGAQLQQQLPNAITKSIADKLSTKGSLGVDEAKAEAIKITNEKIDKTNLSDEQKTSLKKQAETRINNLAEEAKKKNDTPQAELDAFREGLGESDNILGAFGVKTLEAVKALSSFKQGALADFSEGLKDASKAAKDAQNYFKKARDIRVQGDMNLREVMTGVGETYDEKQARVMGDVSKLAGGETTVRGIQNRMVGLQAQRTAVEEKRQGISDPNELKKSAEQLRSLDDQLRDTREALDTLATSTELVEKAFDNLKNVRELQKNRESFVNQLLTNTPEEADKLNKTFIRLQRNLSGGLNNASNQRDARKAFNQTLRETGSVREATKAGNTVLANQRKETLALSQDPGVRAAQELNIRNQYAQGKGKPGVSADQAVADYFKQQQIQLTKSMAIESGMMNNPLVRQSIAAMEDPNADPAMKEASSKYLQSVGLQADATKAQGELALLESQQALVSANANLKVSIDDLRTTIEASMLNNDMNEGRVNAAGQKVVNPGVAVAAPVAPPKARGGLIYASEGQLVNFQPQGTDTVPAMLTPGEFVINARSTAEHLPLLKAINSGNYSKGGVVYLADGGKVAKPRTRADVQGKLDAEREEATQINRNIESRTRSYNSSDSKERASDEATGRELVDAEINAGTRNFVASTLDSVSGNWSTDEDKNAYVADYAESRARRRLENNTDMVTGRVGGAWDQLDDKQKQELIDKEKEGVNSVITDYSYNPGNYKDTWKETQIAMNARIDHSGTMRDRRERYSTPEEKQRLGQIDMNRNQGYAVQANMGDSSATTDRSIINDLDLVENKPNSTNMGRMASNAVNDAYRAAGIPEEAIGYGPGSGMEFHKDGVNWTERMAAEQAKPDFEARAQANMVRIEERERKLAADRLKAENVSANTNSQPMPVENPAKTARETAEVKAKEAQVAKSDIKPDMSYTTSVVQPSLPVPLVKAEVVPWGRGTTTKIRPTQEAINEKKKIKSEELRRRSLWLKGSKGRSSEEETEYATLKSNQIKREVGPYTVEKDRNISSLVNSAYRKGAQSNEITPEERSALKELGSDRRNRGSLRALSFIGALPPITSNGGKPGSVDPAMASRINEGYSRPSNEQQAAEQNAVIESGFTQQYTTNKPLQKPDPNDPKYKTRDPLLGLTRRIADNRAYEAQQTQQATQTNTSVNLRTPEIKNEDGRLGVNNGPMVPSPRVSLPGDYVAGRNYTYGSDPNTPRFESQKTVRDRESSRRDWFDFPLGSPSNVLATETMIKYPNQLFKPNSQINSYQSVGATDPYEYSNDPNIRAKAETQNVYRITASPGLSSSIQTATTSSDTKKKREADSAITSTKIGIEKRAQIAAQEQAFDVEFNQKLEASRSGKDPNTYAMEDDPEEREKYKKGRRQQVINERNQAKLDEQTGKIDNKFNQLLSEGKVKEDQREQYRTEQRKYMPKPYMEKLENYVVPTTEQLLQDQANSEAIAQFEGAQQVSAAEKVRAQQQKAEEDRQASLYINSSNPAIAAAGYVGGVTQGIGDALYGAANITAGAVATVASPIVGGIGYAMSGDDTAFKIGDENNLRNRTAENMYDEARANGRPMPSPQEIAAAQDAAVIRARAATANSERLNNQPGAYSAATRAAAEVGVNAMGAGAMGFVEAGQAVAGMGPIQTGEQTALQRNDARNVQLAGGMDSYLGFGTAFAQTTGYAASQGAGALINAEGAVFNAAGRIGGAAGRVVSSGAGIARRAAGNTVGRLPGAGRFARSVGATVDNVVGGAAQAAGDVREMGSYISGAFPRATSTAAAPFRSAGRAVRAGVDNFVEGVQDVATQMGDVLGVKGIVPDWAKPRVNPTTKYAPTNTAASAASVKNAKQGTIYVKPRPGQTQQALGYDPTVNAAPQRPSTVYVQPRKGQVPDATPGSGSVDDSLRTTTKADADAKAKLDSSKTQAESVNKARADADASAKVKADAAAKAKADAAKMQDDAAAKTRAKDAAKVQQEAADRAKVDAAAAKADAKSSTTPSKAGKASSAIDSAKEMSKEEFLSKLSSSESSVYDILGVQPGTPLTSQGVRDLVRKYNKFTHPDLGGSAELQARLNKIVELASDPDSLSQYDTILKNGIRLKDGTIVRPSPDRLLSVWKTKKVKGQVVPFAQSSFADLAPAGTKAKSTASTATATQSTKKAPSKAELREQSRASVRSSRQAERQSLAKMQKAELESMTSGQKAQMQAAREARMKPFSSNAEESAFAMRGIIKNSNLDTKAQETLDSFFTRYIDKNTTKGPSHLSYSSLYDDVTRYLVDSGLNSDDLMTQLYAKFDKGYNDFDLKLIRDVKEARQFPDGLRTYDPKVSKERPIAGSENAQMVIPGVRRTGKHKQGPGLYNPMKADLLDTPITKRGIAEREARLAASKATFDDFIAGVNQAKTPASLTANKQLAQLDAQIASLRSQEKPDSWFGLKKGVSKKEEIDKLLKTRNTMLYQAQIDEGKRVFEIEKTGLGQSYYDESDPLWKSAVEAGIPNQFRTYGSMRNAPADLIESAEAYGRLSNSYKQSRGVGTGRSTTSVDNKYVNYSGFEGAIIDPKTGKRSLEKFETKAHAQVEDTGKPVYEFDSQGGIHVRGPSLRAKSTEIYNIPADEVTPEIIEKLHKLGIQKFNKGGIVYANNGALIPYLSQGTDTVPAMLTPGEFVVNRESSQQHMPLLNAINSGHFNRGGIVNYLANGGIVAPKYYAAAGLVSGGSGGSSGSSGVSNDISSSISAAVGQAMNQLSTALQSGMETYSQMMQSSTETLNNFGQTFASASQTIASSANTWSETASQIPTSLTAEVTGRQVVDFTGLGKEGDRIVSSAAQAGQLAGSQTSQNTMAKYDRSQFEGNLNTAANNRPMRT